MLWVFAVGTLIWEHNLIIVDTVTLTSTYNKDCASLTDGFHSSKDSLPFEDEARLNVI
jgi:hypothetical protein